MAKYGVELSIDVTKIEKARLFQGKKGKYLTMTVFIDPDNKDQFGNNGMITHKKNEGEERAPILGNCKVFWSDAPQQHTYQNAPQAQQGYQNQPNPTYEQAQPQAQPAPGGFDPLEDIPFSNYQLKTLV